MSSEHVGKRGYKYPYLLSVEYTNNTPKVDTMLLIAGKRAQHVFSAFFYHVPCNHCSLIGLNEVDRFNMYIANKYRVLEHIYFSSSG